MDGYKIDRTILSSWNKDSLLPKIELIQDAIELGKTLRFKYYAPSGTTERKMEPYFLIFKWSSWYVYGYCLLRNDFRMFKLNRMVDIAHVGTFERKRDVPMPDLSNEKVFPPKAKVKAVFESSIMMQILYGDMQAVRSGVDLTLVGGTEANVKDYVCPDGCVCFRMTVEKTGAENFYNRI